LLVVFEWLQYIKKHDEELERSRKKGR